MDDLIEQYQANKDKNKAWIKQEIVTYKEK